MGLWVSPDADIVLALTVQVFVSPLPPAGAPSPDALVSLLPLFPPGVSLSLSVSYCCVSNASVSGHTYAQACCTWTPKPAAHTRLQQNDHCSVASSNRTRDPRFCDGKTSEDLSGPSRLAARACGVSCVAWKGTWTLTFCFLLRETGLSLTPSALRKNRRETTHPGVKPTSVPLPTV